ncbi:3'-phosphoadenosine 5'-phosphosulfate sulfotransferase [Methylobacterium terrae]|uniref:3'-phosphoadenosine 5'-phosphosulfate sulfotransferase n=2 Tax=Methylobacterium terrae TaxID=2202827 RepID=A0A2U8WUM5_9HYPH|nr:3'-phosphoadenosine 5'-phosphosulfate sulfotransferase [Methylobacterium terrae]
MLKHIIDAHGGQLPADVHVAFCNTGLELPETLDFVQECASRWGVRIVWLEFDPEAEHSTRIVSHNSASRNGEPFDASIRTRNMLPNPVMRTCTIDMKVKRLQAYMRKILGYPQYNSVVGLRHDEQKRVKRMHARAKSNKDGKGIIPVMPLDEAKVSRWDVVAWWKRQNFDLRLPSINGKTPHGNCSLCFLKAKRTVQGIMREAPALADWWIGKERTALLVGATQDPRLCLFRADRPSYERMLQQVRDQGDIEDIGEGEVDDDCACTD